MATTKINGRTIITYEYESYQKIYWKSMSNHIIKIYGRKKFEKSDEVENIMNDCFTYLLKEFTKIITPINKLAFYRYCFFLHEESLNLIIDSRDGFNLNNHVNEADFSRYRRILKLILEQGCDQVLLKNPKAKYYDFLIFENIIEKLFYLGTWLYSIADHIAYQKMIGDVKAISFDENDILIEWKDDFGKLYTHLFTNSHGDYEKAISDNSLTTDLIKAINENYEIDYNFACGIIFEIQQHHSKSIFQTIEPYVLPINLSNHSRIDIDSAKQFYDGLSLSKDNKMTILNCILKPYSTERYLFRPLLIYNIEGVKRAFISKNKLAESIYVLASNAILWNTLPNNWLQNVKMQKFINRKGDEHDKLLEDEFQKALQMNNFKFARNVKSLKTSTPNNFNINNHLCGEIDFIILNEKQNLVIVADSKYNKARYEGVGYRTDYSNFKNKYEPQLSKKVQWIEQNLPIVESHFRKTYNKPDFSIKNYSVIGVFFINTPTFYMYNSKFIVITVSKINQYLQDGNINKPINIEYEGLNYEYTYPYFSR